MKRVNTAPAAISLSIGMLLYLLFGSWTDSPRSNWGQTARRDWGNEVPKPIKSVRSRPALVPWLKSTTPVEPGHQDSAKGRFRSHV